MVLHDAGVEERSLGHQVHERVVCAASVGLHGLPVVLAQIHETLRPGDGVAALDVHAAQEEVEASKLPLALTPWSGS